MVKYILGKAVEHEAQKEYTGILWKAKPNFLPPTIYKFVWGYSAFIEIMFQWS